MAVWAGHQAVAKLTETHKTLNRHPSEKNRHKRA